jgi:hypothetical protein
MKEEEIVQASFFDPLVQGLMQHSGFRLPGAFCNRA